MAPWLIPAAMTVMQAGNNSRDEAAARQAARAKLRASYLASLGYPTYQLDAAAMDKDIRGQYGGQNWLGPAALQTLGGFAK